MTPAGTVHITVTSPRATSDTSAVDWCAYLSLV
jgi:hypothetical protein